MDKSGKWILGIVLFLAGADIYSAPTHMSSVQEVLKGIKPAARSCTQHDANQAALSQHGQVAKPIEDLSCAITPTDLAHQIQSPRTLLVDTRSVVEFSTFHIDGAINMNSTELRSKPFFHDKTVVMMGNGKAEREQYINCKRLQSEGFKQVKVLRGGMSTWLADGHSVLGLPPKPAELRKLTASELWIESQFKANLVLVPAKQEALQKQVSGSLLIPDEKPQTIQLQIKQRKSNRKSRSLAAVILVTDNETDTQAISEAIKPVPLLVYSETADAYARALKQQGEVWTARARGPKQPSGCGH